MATHEIATRDEWLTARRQLLEAEKRLTRSSDEVARQRQALPWVRLDKSYRFDTGGGAAALADLFQGRSQLLIYHFMFGPDYQAGCPSCSSIADGFNGIVTHLAHHDVMLWAVSRAPLATLQAYQRRMGWTFPWASSADSDFNFDFHASFTPAQQQAGAEYNFRRDDPAMKMATAAAPPAEFVSWAGTTGTDLPTYLREREGLSAFVLEDGVVYHTYSTYSRGTDAIWGMYAWLDRAPRGRNESGLWLRRRDEYGDVAAVGSRRP
ncbi:thioredoxin [Achromobacter xylosoxidans]|nr:thioredoxin [Achromobacter xylosoxidans]